MSDKNKHGNMQMQCKRNANALHEKNMCNALKEKKVNKGKENKEISQKERNKSRDFFIDKNKIEKRVDFFVYNIAEGIKNKAAYKNTIMKTIDLVKYADIRKNIALIKIGKRKRKNEMRYLEKFDDNNLNAEKLSFKKLEKEKFASLKNILKDGVKNGR